MKNCFKCGKAKPPSEFYRHPRMADGYLGKCKVCTRADSEARRKKKEQEPGWMAKEAARHRAKTLANPPQVTAEKRLEYQKRYRAKYPEKTRARQQAKRALAAGKIMRIPCHCGQPGEMHHPDYTRPLDVVWLCDEHHKLSHRKY